MLEYPSWYLKWCRENERLQAWWRDQDLSARPCRANMSVGDRFMLGFGDRPQFGFVTAKIIVVGTGPEFPRFEWHIAGDIGGWRWVQNSGMPECFYWIPTAEQLAYVGEGPTAEHLLDHYKTRTEADRDTQ